MKLRKDKWDKVPLGKLTKVDWGNTNITKSSYINEGYGAFSYSHSHIDNVAKYVMNQKEHHKKISFKEEYIDFLKKFEIEYDEKYLFDWMD